MKNSDYKIPPFSLVYNMYISGLYGATPRRSGGLKICMHKILQGDPFSEITLFLKGYNLNTSRFQLSDILVFIAGTFTAAL